MIGGNPEMSGAALDHGQNGSQHTTDRADFLAVHVRSRGYGVEMAEQFVSSINQMNIHAEQSFSAGNGTSSTKFDETYCSGVRVRNPLRAANALPNRKRITRVGFWDVI